MAVVDGPYDARGLLPILARAPINIGSVACNAEPNVGCDHGTFIMGLLGAGRDAPFPGLCPRCKLMHIPLFSDGAVPGASIEQLANALAVAVLAGAKLINLSLTILDDDTEDHPALKSALDKVEASGGIVMAAAGNQGRLTTGQLLSHPVTVPVVAVDAEGRLLADCNFGPAISRRGVAALGHNVLGYAPGGRTAVMSGTSVATAVATGTLADLWSARPDADGLEMRVALARLAPRNKAVPPMIDRDGVLASIERTKTASVATAIPRERGNSVHARLQGETTMNVANGLPASPNRIAGPATISAVAPAHGSPECACGLPGGVCTCGNNPSLGHFIYVLGTVDIRFPNQSISEELQSVAQRLSERTTDPEPEIGRDEPLRQWYARILHRPEARYVARQVCWILKVEGIPAYYLTLRDLRDLDELINFLAKPEAHDLDLVVGSSSLVPVENCPGIIAPVLAVDQLFSIDLDELTARFGISSSTPKEPSTTKGRYPLDPDASGHDPEKFFRRLVQSADNLGDTDEWRALNYLAVRYKVLYQQYAEMMRKDYILDSIKVETSRLSREKRIVDPVFTFHHKTTGVPRKYFVRVDVSYMYPMIANELAER